MRRRPAILLSLAALGGLALGVLGVDVPVRAQSETTVLGDLISRVLSTSSTRVTIGAVDGALSSDATIRNVAIADRDGVWLRLDRARLVWRRAALFSRRLEIDRLELGKLEFLRRPVPSEAAAPAASNEPLLPELPVKVEVKAFSLAELQLGEPVVGVAARLSASGSTKLGPPAEGLDLTLEAKRLDAAGTFSAKLAFVPQGERLDLKFLFDEPAGGLVARLANLPGLPPVRLDVTGAGVLDDWRANLAFAAGPEVGATGGARLVREGAGRRLGLDLSARLEGLLPPVVAPVFAGETKLTGNVALQDDGSVALQGLDLASQTAALAVKGTLSAERMLDVTATARALPTSGSVTKAGASEIASLNFDGAAKGPLAAPRITGRLAARGVASPQGKLGSVDANLLVDPLAAPTDPKEPHRFAVTADAKAEGIALADADLSRAIGPRADIVLDGVWGTDGQGTAKTLRATLTTAEASYTGIVGRTSVDGTLVAKVGDLSAFAGLAGRPISGRANVTARLSGAFADGIAADLDGTAEALRVGQAVADGLIGGRLAVQGRAQRLRDGFAFAGLTAKGAHVTATLDGRATAGAADLSAKLALPDLARVDPRLAGPADAMARLTGSLARPDVQAVVTTGQGARVIGRRVQELRAEVMARNVTGDIDAGLMLSGMIDDKALSGRSRLRRMGADFVIDPVDLMIGAARIGGRAALSESGLAEGSLKIVAPNLDDLSPLVLTKLSGNLSLDLTLTRTDGKQGAKILAKGKSLRVADVALNDLDADLSGSDVYGRVVIDGHVFADRLVAAGQTFESVRLDAAGTPSASDIALKARAQGFNFESAAKVLPQDKGVRIDLSTLTAERANRRIALAQPARIDLRDGVATIAGLIVAVEGGQISVSGKAGSTLALDVAVRSLPLAAAEIVKPGLGLSGTLDGEANITGTASAPKGRFRLNASRISVPATRDAGLPAIDAKASGTLAGTYADIEADANAGTAVQVKATGRVPLAADGPLALRIAGRADAAIANATLSATGQRITGRLVLDGSVKGTVQRPLVEGSATLSDGSFTDPLQGVRLMNIRGRVSGRGSTVTIDNLSASTRNGGTIGIKGEVEVAPDRGFPGQLRITASRAELVSSDLATAVANLDVALSGALAQTPRIAGRVDLVSLDVTIPEQLPVNVKPLPNTRHIRPPPAIRRQLALDAKAKARAGKSGPPFNATLDLTIAAPNRIFVRGRGIDAELGGDLKLTGSSRDPVAIGAFELRRGRLTIIGQRIDFTRGKLSFAGDLTPDLDLVAETSAGDVTARVAVTGPANQPTFDISSEPALPQDEVLSRLLFQKASGNLSGFQALQLAQAVSQLAGGSAGPDIFDRARRSLGLDSLDVTAGAGGGVAVGASRYINDRISVGVRAGAKAQDSAATVNIDVTRRLRVQGEVGADGHTSVGLGAEWEY